MRVEKSARPLVRRTLQWIAYAKWPALSDEQLLEIVAIDENDEELDPEACPDLEDLLRCCGSLVRRVNEFSDSPSYGIPSYDRASYDRLELAHFTVQEFLEAIKPEDTSMNEFRLSKTDTLTLAKTCVNYLCLPSFDRLPSDFENDLEDHPFYRHVSRNLTNYVQEAKHEGDMQGQLRKLFRSPKSYNLTRFILHKIAMNTHQRHEWIDEVCSHEFGSMHAAAMLPFGTICRWLLDEGCDVNGSSALGTPLELALLGPRLSYFKEPVISKLEWLNRDDVQRTVSILLEAGADWNVDGVDTESLLNAMSLTAWGVEQLGETCDEDLIKKLFVNLDGVENADIPLEVRMRLLDLTGTKNVGSHTIPTMSTMGNMSDEVYAEALFYTTKHGLVSELLRLTKDERFSVNMKTKYRASTLLRIAAEHDSLECMELLLDRYSEDTGVDKFGRTDLNHAVNSGVGKIALLHRLIQRNSTEVVDCDGRSVWHVVAEKGRLDVLDVLIAELGPDHHYFHMESKLGRTPLLEAIMYRQSHIVSRILRSLPVDKPFATDPRVVHSIVAHGLEDTLRELVEMGASILTRPDQDQSALYFITQKTTPGMLRTLLDHGLDVDRIDSHGRSPFVDFLEVDQHSRRLESLGYSDVDCRNLELSVVELIATPFCVIIQDKESNSAWFYFCTKTIPHALSYLRLPSEFDLIIDVMNILIQRGALEAYQEAVAESGLALLIKVCLDTISKGDMESWEALSFVRVILRHISETITASNLPSSHRQVERLLIWSMTQSEDIIFERLLRLGVDVHATCEDYGGDSATDIAIEGNVREKFFRMVLDHADSLKIPKLNAHGYMRYFALCVPPKVAKVWHLFQDSDSDEEDIEPLAIKNVLKLEAILRKGVDSNAKDHSHRTAAHVAASNGYLEPIKVLVENHADLTIMDDHGWTVIHGSVASGNVVVAKYLRQLFPEQAEWERPVALNAEILRFHNIPLGPLPLKRYHDCTLAHLAAYSESSAMLQFLRDNNITGNINGRTQEGATPLHFAVCLTSSRTTRWLLEDGADVNAKCGTRDTSALHFAFRLGCLDNSIALIEAGAEFSADSAGITPEMQVDPMICADLLEDLPNIGVSIPHAVMEVIRRRQELKSYGDLYDRIVNGDLEGCRSIIAATPCFHVIVDGCGPCTPLILALAHGQLSIAKLLLDHGAYTNGVSCTKTNRFGFEASALEIAVQNPLFNSLLEQLLKCCLSHESHWSQRFGYWRPFHLAAAFNSEAIQMLADHVLGHIALFRYVSSSIYQCEVTFSIRYVYIKTFSDTHIGIV